MDGKSDARSGRHKHISLYRDKHRTPSLSQMYKKGDVVLVRSLAGPAIPHIHVRLHKKIVQKPKTYGEFNDKGYVAWEGALVYKGEIQKLNKEWSISWKYPDNVEIFVFEEDIIKKL